MAKIVPGAIVEDIRGGLNNVVYSVSKRGVHTVRSRPKSVHNPVSLDQSYIRTLMQVAGKRWENDLSDAQRAGWEAMADILNGLSKEPGGGSQALVPAIGMSGSGFNAYVGFYVRSFSAGLGGSFSDDAPVGEDQPTDPTSIVASYADPTLTVTWVDPTTKDASANIVQWIKGKQGVYHRQLYGNTALAVQTRDITGARSKGGEIIAFTDVLPFSIIVQLQTVNPSGYASPGSTVVIERCTT